MTEEPQTKRLGKYEIIEEIGRGGFGIVYKARDTTLNRIVALKVLKPLLIGDPAFMARFQQEAQSAAGLEHPNIVTIYELGEQEGMHYIAMKYLEGKSLDKIIAEGPLTFDRAAKIVAQLAAALDYAHAKGLIHRDVKPNNIIIGVDDHATLTDFGLVKANLESGISSSGQVLGSPEYMSPEQAEGKPVDGRADVYALGVVFFEMLAGNVPFKADSTPALLYKQVFEPVPHINTIRKDLPEKIEPVIAKALAKKPAERYQNATELSNAIAQVISTPGTKPQQKRERNALPVVLLVGLGGVALLTCVCFVIYGVMSNTAVPTSIARSAPPVTPSATRAAALPSVAPTLAELPTTPNGSEPLTSTASKTPGVIKYRIQLSGMAFGVGAFDVIGEVDGNKEHGIAKITPSISKTIAVSEEYIQVGGQTYQRGITTPGSDPQTWYLAASQNSLMAILSPDGLIQSLGTNTTGFEKSRSEVFDGQPCDVYVYDFKSSREVLDSVIGSNKDAFAVIETSEAGLWLCGDGLIHRFTFALEGHAANDPNAKNATKLDVHYWDFGNSSISIVAPKDAQPMPK